jgi:hypothetical protein
VIGSKPRPGGAITRVWKPPLERSKPGPIDCRAPDQECCRMCKHRARKTGGTRQGRKQRPHPSSTSGISRCRRFVRGFERCSDDRQEQSRRSPATRTCEGSSYPPEGGGSAHALQARKANPSTMINMVPATVLEDRGSIINDENFALGGNLPHAKVNRRSHSRPEALPRCGAKLQARWAGPEATR